MFCRYNDFRTRSRTRDSCASHSIKILDIVTRTCLIGTDRLSPSTRIYTVPCLRYNLFSGRNCTSGWNRSDQDCIRPHKIVIGHEIKEQTNFGSRLIVYRCPIIPKSTLNWRVRYRPVWTHPFAHFIYVWIDWESSAKKQKPSLVWLVMLVVHRQHLLWPHRKTLI